MTELQGCFEQKEVHIARLAEENLAYAHEYTNYTWEKAGAVYDRLVEKGCLMDQEWGRETFCFRLTGRKKGNFLSLFPSNGASPISCCICFERAGAG